METRIYDDSSSSPLDSVGEVPYTSRLWRHPADIRLIGKFSLTVILLCIVSFTSLGIAAYAVFRKPEVILVVNRRTITLNHEGKAIKDEEVLESVNNRQYGVANDVQLQKDQPGAKERQYAASNWVRRYMTVSQAVVERKGDKVRTVRQAELVSLMKWMVPEAAQSFTRFLLKNKLIETEVQERWQATWEEQTAVPDPNDPYLWRITGRQSVTKFIGGQPVSTTRQIQFALKLSDDPAGRREDNMMTGVQPISLDFQPLGE